MSFDVICSNLFKLECYDNRRGLYRVDSEKKICIFRIVSVPSRTLFTCNLQDHQPYKSKVWIRSPTTDNNNNKDTRTCYNIFEGHIPQLQPSESRLPVRLSDTHTPRPCIEPLLRMGLEECQRDKDKCSLAISVARIPLVGCAGVLPSIPWWVLTMDDMIIIHLLLP